MASLAFLHERSDPFERFLDELRATLTEAGNTLHHAARRRRNAGVPDGEKHGL